VTVETATEGTQTEVEGTVAHVDGTEEIEVLYVRATLFLADGSTSISVLPVYPDGTFVQAFTGNVVHVTFVVTDTRSCLNPEGEWLRVGVYEIDP